MSRLLLLSSAIALASVTGHTAMGESVTAFGLFLTVALATVLANPISRKPPRIGQIAVVALGSQVLIHLILAITAHGHGPLLPGFSMLAGHAIASLVIALVAVEADRILNAFRRLFGCITFTLPGLHPQPAHVLLSPLQSPFGRPRTPWDSRGPPLHS